MSLGTGWRVLRVGMAALVAIAACANASRARASIAPPSAAAAPPTTKLPSLQGADPFDLGAEDSDAVYAARWRGVRREIASDRAVLAGCRVDPGTCPESARRLLAIVESARSRDGRARLGEVNRAVNLAIRYVSDEVQHGQDDVWSAPLATFASGMGDCEDYAIAKYVALLEAGLDEADLRLVLVRNARKGDLHAVLAARQDSDWLILDNARFALVADRDLAEYRAVIALDMRERAPVVAATRPADATPPTRVETAS